LISLKEKKNCLDFEELDSMKLEYEKSKASYQSEEGENSIFLINSNVNEEMKELLKQHTNEKNKRKRIFQNEFTSQVKKKQKKTVVKPTTQRKQRKKKDDEPKTLLETVKLILPSQMEVSSPATASSSNQDNFSNQEDLDFESQLEAQLEMNANEKEEKPKKKRKRKIETISSDLIDSSIDAFLSSKKTKPNLPPSVKKVKKPTAVPKVVQNAVVQDEVTEVSKEQFEGSIVESMKRTPRTRKPTERYLESIVKTEKDESFL
jgi:hypothetical protein